MAKQTIKERIASYSEDGHPGRLMSGNWMGHLCIVV